MSIEKIETNSVIWRINEYGSEGTNHSEYIISYEANKNGFLNLFPTLKDEVLGGQITLRNSSIREIAVALNQLADIIDNKMRDD